MSYAVAWSDHAVRALMDLHWRDGQRVDGAVIEYARTGKGFVRVVETAEGATEHRLHVSAFYIRFTVDEAARVITIWALQRVLPR